VILTHASSALIAGLPSRTGGRESIDALLAAQSTAVFLSRKQTFLKISFRARIWTEGTRLTQRIRQK